MIEGASQAAYDGVVTVGTVLSGTQFTAPVAGTPTFPSFSYGMTWTAYATLDNAISRPDGVEDNSSGVVLETDSFLGENTIVQSAHPQTGIELTYVDQSDGHEPPAYAATGAGSLRGA